MADGLTDPLPLALALLAEESVTPQAAGCFDLIEGWLTRLGFTVHRRVFEEAGHPPTENLYARLGTAAPNLCFAGHVDVVPAGDPATWDSPPFEPQVRGGYLYGRGAEDMKGAIAAMIAAVARYLEAGKTTGGISFLLTADEEGSAVNGTPKALPWVTGELGQTLDYCLIGEPTNPSFLGEMAKIGRRGSLLAKLTVTGRQGHVAYPHLADNPITRMVALLHALKAIPIDEGSAFFPPSNLEVTTVDVGNPIHNMIPAQARAEFSVRFNDLHDGAAIERLLRERLNAVSGEYDLAVRVSGESFLSPPGVLSDALSDAVETVTGQRPQLSTTGGTSDARFIREHCPVIEFGTTGFTPHHVNERVAVEVLEGLTAIYAAFLARLLNGAQAAG